jgi:hypothetical protein
VNLSPLAHADPFHGIMVRNSITISCSMRYALLHACSPAASALGRFGVPGAQEKLLEHETRNTPEEASSFKKD